MEPWIGVDLDGTLAQYHGWNGLREIGKPILPMVSRVKMWIHLGKKVKIFTARVSEDPEGKAKKAIEEWCKRHLGQVLEVTCTKDYGMVELWDDRAVQVVPNTGRRVGVDYSAT